jgi:hypothetical protein
MVADDYRDGLISKRTVEQIYHVVIDEARKAANLEATTAARTAERNKRKKLGKPYAEFIKGWETEHPPAHLPFYGSWKDPTVIYRGTPTDTCPADAIVGVMMPDPKDVRIAQLEAKLAQQEKA